MNTPKVGEIWVSNNDTTHTILFVRNTYIVTKTSNDLEYAFDKGSLRNVINSNLKLVSKKKKRVTLYVGWRKDDYGYFSHTYSVPIQDPSDYAHVQTIEFDVEE